MRETKFYDIKYINFRRCTVVRVYEKYIICRSVRVQIFLYEHFVSLAIYLIIITSFSNTGVAIIPLNNNNYNILLSNKLYKLSCWENKNNSLPHYFPTSILSCMNGNNFLTTSRLRIYHIYRLKKEYIYHCFVQYGGGT